MPEAGNFPWRWLFAGLVALVALCLLGGWWWLTSTGDLDAFEKRARAAGVRLEPAPPDPAAARALAALLLGVRGVPDLDPMRIPADPALARQFLAVGWDASLAAIDRLPAGGGDARTDIDGIARLIAGRLVYGDPAAIPLLVHRLRILAAACGSEEGYGNRFRLLRPAAYALCARLGVGDLPRDEELVADLGALADLLEEECRNSAAGRLREIFRISRRNPGSLLRELGIMIPAVYESGLGILCLERFGRGPLLDKLAAWDAAARAAPDMRTLMAYGRPAVWPPPKSGWDLLPNRYLPSLFKPWQVASGHFPGISRFRLLAAELGGTPWPEDLLAAPGVRFQRVERDGRLVGAYSVGMDGRDDGGFRSGDSCIPLGGIMGRPRMGDPPPVEAQSPVR